MIDVLVKRGRCSVLGNVETLTILRGRFRMDVADDDVCRAVGAEDERIVRLSVGSW